MRPSQRSSATRLALVVAGRKLNSCASSFCGVAMVLFAISLSTPGALSLRQAMVRSSLPPTATSRPMAPFCRSSIRRELH